MHRPPLTDIAPSPTTTELVTAAAGGDQKAWATLLARYGGLVTATIRSFRLQDADATDATQSTWLRLVENADRLHTPERLGGWLVTVAARECLAILRRGRHESGSDDEIAAAPDGDPGPEDRVIRAETERRVRHAVRALAPRRGELIAHLFADGPASYAELAVLCRLPIGSIGPTRARTLADLRRSLEDFALA